jgi:hypothetical protein
MYKYLLFLIFLLLPACTVYTEKRSEALSQAVFATADSIKVARFDKADEYANQAKRLAYAPKDPIKIGPIVTGVESINGTTEIKPQVSQKFKNKIQPVSSMGTSVITATTKNNTNETVLRLVVPEFLKHAKLLIENSDEWNELMKTKDFKDQLEQDNKNLKELAENIDQELKKQLLYNNKMVEDLNKLQKEVLSKKLHILKLYIIIFILLATIGGGVYLRIKGIL